MKKFINFEAYPFEKLNDLLQGITPNSDYSPLSLTIGEPQFDTPKFIIESFTSNAQLLNKYPKSAGEEYLKDALIQFNKTRFGVTLTPEEIIPTFGTREVLFNFPQFFLHEIDNPTIAYTNPFYQIYEGAAIASKATIIHIDLKEENDFKPIIDEKQLSKCDLVIINFPNNPTASVLDIDELGKWVELALKYDFVLINDECYSEIYTNTPPPSLLEASIKVGNTNYKNILVMNSISKRSSAPGLRSGFIAGDAEILKSYLVYRTYVGAAVPLPLQKAAASAWVDEAHVSKARDEYVKNFEAAKEILGITIPKATFYVWLEVNDEIEFTKKAFREKNLKVLPGSFLGRNGQGKGFVRLALVYDNEKNRDALTRIKSIL